MGRDATLEREDENCCWQTAPCWVSAHSVESWLLSQCTETIPVICDTDKEPPLYDRQQILKTLKRFTTSTLWKVDESPKQKENLKAVVGNVYDTHYPSWLEECNMHTHTGGQRCQIRKIRYENCCWQTTPCWCSLSKQSRKPVTFSEPKPFQQLWHGTITVWLMLDTESTQTLIHTLWQVDDDTKLEKLKAVVGKVFDTHQPLVVRSRSQTHILWWEGRETTLEIYDENLLANNTLLTVSAHRQEAGYFHCVPFQ